ncbi:hypothetical protein EJ110_NYTH26265 [Nymphaea thermarum]|nr:hypothetical protein EJ110_NYTH26265 [Nymphaea thermarum]
MLSRNFMATQAGNGRHWNFTVASDHHEGGFGQQRRRSNNGVTTVATVVVKIASAASSSASRRRLSGASRRLLAASCPLDRPPPPARSHSASARSIASLRPLAATRCLSSDRLLSTTRCCPSPSVVCWLSPANHFLIALSPPLPVSLVLVAVSHHQRRLVHPETPLLVVLSSCRRLTVATCWTSFSAIAFRHSRLARSVFSFPPAWSSAAALHADLLLSVWWWRLKLLRLTSGGSGGAADIRGAAAVRVSTAALIYLLLRLGVVKFRHCSSALFIGTVHRSSPDASPIIAAHSSLVTVHPTPLFTQHCSSLFTPDDRACSLTRRHCSLLTPDACSSVWLRLCLCATSLPSPGRSSPVVRRLRLHLRLAPPPELFPVVSASVRRRLPLSFPVLLEGLFPLLTSGTARVFSAPAILCSGSGDLLRRPDSGDLLRRPDSGDLIPATWSVLLPLISMAASFSSTVNQTEIEGVRTENVPMQVINLRLTKENYFSWSPAMTMGIAARDRMTYIDGSNPEPARTSEICRQPTQYPELQFLASQRALLDSDQLISHGQTVTKQPDKALNAYDTARNFVQG